MTTPETAAWSKCHNCGQSVAVKKNKGGLAYYRCDHCGISHTHHWQRSSDKFIQSLGVAPEPKAAPVVEPVPTKSPPKADKAKATFFG